MSLQLGCSSVYFPFVSGSYSSAKCEAFSYPVVYITTVLPLAATRWSSFKGHDVPLWAIMMAEVLFDSSGLFNTVLFAATRSTLLSGSKGPKIVEIPLLHRVKPVHRLKRRDDCKDVDSLNVEDRYV